MRAVSPAPSRRTLSTPPGTPDGLAALFSEEDAAAEVEDPPPTATFFEAWVRETPADASLPPRFWRFGGFTRPFDRPWGGADRAAWVTAYLPDLRWRVQVPSLAKSRATMVAGAKKAIQVLLRQIDPVAFSDLARLGATAVDLAAGHGRVRQGKVSPVHEDAHPP